MNLMQAVEHYATAMKLSEQHGNKHGDIDAANNALNECKKFSDELTAAKTQIEDLQLRIGELEDEIKERSALSARREAAFTKVVHARIRERVVSDKLEKVTQECANNLGLTYKQIMSICKEALAEVSALRSANPAIHSKGEQQ